MLLALLLDVRAAGPKGLGAFAPAPIAEGAHVCDYEGELLSLQQVEDRYGYTPPDFLLGIGDDAFLDAAEGTHASRYINHAEDGNLAALFVPDANAGRGRATFRAARPISAGEELSFDYGLGYWIPRGDPVDDSRVPALRRLRRSRALRRESGRLLSVWSSLLAPLVIPIAASALLLGDAVADGAPGG